MKLYANILSASLAIFSVAAGTHAGTIVSYDFSVDGQPTLEAADTNSTVMTGAGWTSGGSASFGRSTAGNYFGRGPSTTAVTSWVGFTITAAAGYELDLDQLDFDYYVQQSQSGVNFTFEVRSSVDSYASPILGTYSENPTTQDTTLENATLDLTGGSYDGLASITFRLYAKSDDTPAFNDIMRWDNIAVTGDAALVPEPTSLALLGLGGLLVARRRR